MPVSDKKLRSVLEQGIQDYIDKRGPKKNKNAPQAAKKMKSKIDQLVDELSRDFSEVGEYIKPGLKKALKNYFNKKVEKKI